MEGLPEIRLGGFVRRNAGVVNTVQRVEVTAARKDPNASDGRVGARRTRTENQIGPDIRYSE